MKIKPTCATLSAKLMREIKFPEFYNFLLWLAFEIGEKTCKKAEKEICSRKGEKGEKDISLRRIGRNSLRKLSKLASFCSRHEWSPGREIEKDFSNLKHFVTPEPEMKLSYFHHFGSCPFWFTNLLVTNILVISCLTKLVFCNVLKCEWKKMWMLKKIKTLSTFKIPKNPNPGNPQIVAFERKSTEGVGKESKMGKNA